VSLLATGCCGALLRKATASQGNAMRWGAGEISAYFA